jgi:hypothetical protein
MIRYESACPRQAALLLEHQAVKRRALELDKAELTDRKISTAVAPLRARICSDAQRSNPQAAPLARVDGLEPVI